MHTSIFPFISQHTPSFQAPPPTPHCRRPPLAFPTPQRSIPFFAVLPFTLCSPPPASARRPTFPCPARMKTQLLGVCSGRPADWLAVCISTLIHQWRRRFPHTCQSGLRLMSTKQLAQDSSPSLGLARASLLQIYALNVPCGAG